MSTRTRAVAKALAALAIVAVALTGCATTPKAQPADGGQDTATPTTRTFVDELGREVEISLPVTAVYTDFIYQAEAVRLVGAGDRVVAVGDAAHPDDPKNKSNKKYLESFHDAVNVGVYSEPNWESVVESGAQVAFVMRNGPYQDAITKLTPFGIPVFVVTGWDPQILRQFIPTLGEIFGTEDQAAKAAKLYDDIDSLLKDRLAGLKDSERKKVYYENAAEYATGVPGSGWHDVIVDAGGINIFGDIKVNDDESAKVHSYPVDPVEIINRDPDVIIRNGVDGLTYGYEKWPEAPWQAQAHAIADRAGWSEVTAVKNGEIYVTNNFFYSTLGKKVGSVFLAKTLYPDRFKDVDIDTYFGGYLELQGVDPVPYTDYVLKYEP